MRCSIAGTRRGYRNAQGECALFFHWSSVFRLVACHAQGLTLSRQQFGRSPLTDNLPRGRVEYCWIRQNILRTPEYILVLYFLFLDPFASCTTVRYALEQRKVYESFRSITFRLRPHRDTIHHLSYQIAETTLITIWTWLLGRDLCFHMMIPHRHGFEQA